MTCYKHSIPQFDVPANAKALIKTLCQMALIGGLLSNITSHDIRQGGARDLSHLKVQLQGVATNSIAKAIGHTRATAAKDVTDGYVGNIHEDIFAMKRSLDYKDRGALHFGPSFKKRRLQPEEIHEMCDRLDSIGQTKLRVVLREIVSSPKS